MLLSALVPDFDRVFLCIEKSKFSRKVTPRYLYFVTYPRSLSPILN